MLNIKQKILKQMAMKFFLATINQTSAKYHFKQKLKAYSNQTYAVSDCQVL